MATAFVTTQDNGKNTMVWQERDFVAAEAQFRKEMSAFTVKFVSVEVSANELISSLESGKKVVYQANGFGVARFVTWECIKADGSFRRMEVICK